MLLSADTNTNDLNKCQSETMSGENTPLLSASHNSITELTIVNKNHHHRFNLTTRFRWIVLFPTFLLILSLLFLKSLSQPATSLANIYGPSVNVRIYTNNIRFDNKHYPDEGEQPWKVRKVQVINSIDFHTSFLGHANVVCLQEVLHHQLEDILFGLGQNQGDWTYYGVGRTDGATRGEYAPVLFKNSDWRVLENSTYWLSETPWKPSRGWDAALERIVTMVTLQSRMNPLIKINVFNTHFDHRGKRARRMSSRLIIDKMENYNDYPSFLCGDFNTQPKDEPYGILKKAGFKDSRTLVDWKYSYGHESTFTGFDKENQVNTIIDYVWSPYFTKPNFKEFGGGGGGGGLDDKEEEQVNDYDAFKSNNFFNLDHHLYYDIQLDNFGIMHNHYKGYYFSDHRPVVATYEIKRTRLF